MERHLNLMIPYTARLVLRVNFNNIKTNEGMYLKILLYSLKNSIYTIYIEKRNKQRFSINESTKPYQPLEWSQILQHA